MHKAQEQVAAFHRAINHTVGETPAIRDAELRAKLILEEAVETIEGLLGARAARYLLFENLAASVDALNDEGCGYAVALWRNAIDGALDLAPTKDTPPNLADVADGICDTLVVLYGTAVACGLDIEPLFNEVMRANMDKTTGPTREDGKRLKPPGWKPPEIARILAEQIAAAAGAVGSES